MKNISLKHMVLVGGVVAATATASAAFDTGTRDAAKTAATTEFAAVSAPVPTRGEKGDLLIGRHAEDGFVWDSAEPVMDEDRTAGNAETGAAADSWIARTTSFFERSSERAWDRTSYLADRLVDIVSDRS